MFPNVRLLIAAAFASILVVIFGFGMLAAIRVNHTPLVRLPPTNATRLVADDGGTPIMAFAAVEPEPFVRRFPASLPPSAHAATDSAAGLMDHSEDVDSSPAASVTVLDHIDTAVQETAAIATLDEPATLVSAQPSDAPAAGNAAATSLQSSEAPDTGFAGDRPAVLAAPPAQEPTVMSNAVVATANQTSAAPEPQPIPDAAAAPPTRSNTPIADASDASGPASAAARVAAIAPSNEWTLSPAQAKPEGATSRARGAKGAKADKEAKHEADKKTKHARSAVRARHKHRASHMAVSATQTSQYASYIRSDFVTAPQWQQSLPAQKQLARSPGAAVAAQRSKDWDSASNSSGGVWPNQ